MILRLVKPGAPQKGMRWRKYNAYLIWKYILCPSNYGCRHHKSLGPVLPWTSRCPRWIFLPTSWCGYTDWCFFNIFPLTAIHAHSITSSLAATMSYELHLICFNTEFLEIIFLNIFLLTVIFAHLLLELQSVIRYHLIRFPCHQRDTVNHALFITDPCEDWLYIL